MASKEKTVEIVEAFGRNFVKGISLRSMVFDVWGAVTVSNYVKNWDQMFSIWSMVLPKLPGLKTV